MADRATTLSIVALGVTLVAFVRWNLEPAAVSLVSVTPDRVEVQQRGPGWPFPSYTVSMGRPAGDVPVTAVFRTPGQDAEEWEREAAADPQYRPIADAMRRSVEQQGPKRWLTNGSVGLLLVLALVANLARAYRDAPVRQPGAANRS